jgi:hypothetical protein
VLPILPYMGLLTSALARRQPTDFCFLSAVCQSYRPPHLTLMCFHSHVCTQHNNDTKAAWKERREELVLKVFEKLEPVEREKVLKNLGDELKTHGIVVPR